jgi:hypothetical protein
MVLLGLLVGDASGNAEAFLLDDQGECMVSTFDTKGEGVFSE